MVVAEHPQQSTTRCAVVFASNSNINCRHQSCLLVRFMARQILTILSENNHCRYIYNRFNFLVFVIKDDHYSPSFLTQKRLYSISVLQKLSTNLMYLKINIIETPKILSQYQEIKRFDPVRTRSFLIKWFQFKVLVLPNLWSESTTSKYFKVDFFVSWLCFYTIIKNWPVHFFTCFAHLRSKVR